MDHLYVRSPYGGRTLLDTIRDNVTHTWEDNPGGWVVTFHGIDSELGEKLVQLGIDLNVFRVKEGAQLKSWYYAVSDTVSVAVSDSPVSYDKRTGNLQIELHHSKDYPG